MTCPRDVAGLWHACALLWICEKNHIKKTVTIHNILKEKTTKLYSQPVPILKTKSTKTIMKIKHKKNEKKKMTILEEKKAKNK